MRLSSIKLSGFKSFVDPTHFVLPGQLVGVVGPNGCGKSNIMDAVRWVLGESKASELRGESMQDVIFNGTTTRKPASRASVELVFDNEDHRAGGQWAPFSEIAVKRVLTREGNSSYFINGQLVRRRDVQDVFLGTGLGPRAYAIIGQGTISRIIESRPEELRLFLEEAAGVSKYKERRRETENRLHDTRENLTRVEDIARELVVNLDKLERQAEVATRFKALQQQLKLRQQQLWYLKREQARAEQDRLAAQSREAINALESRSADLRHIEAELERIRQAHYDAGDAVNQAQGQLYEASTEVGRLETEIRYVVEGRERAQARLGSLHAQLTHWQQQAEQARAQRDALDDEQEVGREQAELLQAQAQEQAQALPALHDALRRAQQRAQDGRTAVARVQQHIEVLAAQQRSLDEQQRSLQQRRERLLADRRALDVPDEATLLALQQRLDDAQAALATAQDQLHALHDALPGCEAARDSASARAQAQHAMLTQTRARLEALRALQAKLQSDDSLQPWLQRQGLDAMPPLWQQLQVEPGWESAVETALRESLSARAVGRLDTLPGLLHDAPPARLAFFGQDAPAVVPDRAGTPGPGVPLLARITACDAVQQAVLAHWLHGWTTADDLGQALAQRSALMPGQCIVVPQGHAVDRVSVRFYASDSAQAGMLARAHEIDQLHHAQLAQAQQADAAQADLSRAERALAELQAQLTSVRRDEAVQQAQVHAVQLDVLRQTQRLEQARQRSVQIDSDLAELDAQLEDLQTRRLEDEAQFETLDAQLAQAQQEQVDFDDAVLAAERAQSDAREQLRQIERQAQESDFAQRSLQARHAELDRTIKNAVAQADQVSAEGQKVQEELSRLDDAAAQAGLQQALALRMQREQTLAQRREQYDTLTRALRASDERRLSIERDLQPLRERITDAQLKEQAARLGFEQYDQRLTDAQADLAALAQSLADGSVRLAALQPEIDRLQRDIDALGPVNLAALDELASARERKQFLDAQLADLGQAMRTLEDAIRNIDAQTRDLLRSTFDTVNAHFGQMFPDLFGGGNARLVMTGEEILDAGVQVIAQPPGKKNQTIHLLSGGEKALTAIALVFAIFQLNPAPFCLLDEVDAPLDDANTERYARLVSRMSRDTQFLFISHNKIAMEMAQQLIGVTMQEQGVSRIVAVDMQAALSLAE
ncbi:MAG: chromosome segregation protein SMC [Rhodoferax sp.]